MPLLSSYPTSPNTPKQHDRLLGYYDFLAPDDLYRCVRSLSSPQQSSLLEADVCASHSFSHNIRLRLTQILSEIIYPRNIPPDARTNVPSPSRFGIENFEDLVIPTPDGEELHAFLIRPGNSQYARNMTILMFHGNAGNIGHRIPIAKILANEIGCNVLMLQYRGYGRSTGDPDEKGLKIDAQTALDFLRSNDELRGKKIIVYGQSLGGAVGINLVARNQEQGDIAGLILENTFTSIRKLIPRYVHIPANCRRSRTRSSNYGAAHSHLPAFSRACATNSGPAKKSCPRSEMFLCSS